MEEIRILLADDHGLLRKGVRTLLEEEPGLAVVGEASDGKEAVRLAEELRPDVVIMDVVMPLLNGIEATARILEGSDKTGVIVLSMHSDGSSLARALSAGAKGYLLKKSAEEVLAQAVRAVAQGRHFFSPEISQVLVQDYLRQMGRGGPQDPYDQLTAREKEVLQLLAKGKTNKTVANLLSLKVSTVEAHRTNLMKKLCLHNAADIVLFAVRRKIVV